jgi:hypothetical protein
MRIHNRCDFNAGILFLLIAAFFAVYATDYSLGTATRMGPGYFPTMLAAIMAILGAITLGMAFSPLDAEDPPGRTDWRGMGLVLSSVLVFAVLLPIAGFLIAVMSLIILSSTASPEFRWKIVLPLATALCTLGYAVFGWGLELQFAIIPPILTR